MKQARILSINAYSRTEAQQARKEAAEDTLRMAMWVGEQLARSTFGERMRSLEGWLGSGKITQEVLDAAYAFYDMERRV